jgi:nucleotide-binding universal stress UspA family protein
MFKSILIPTDGSPQSRKAAARGVALAQSVGAKVIAFFAAPPATPIVYRGNLPVGYTTPKEHEAVIRRTAAKYLGFIKRAANRAGVRCESLHVISDYPDDAILKAAEKKQCDLIVMATRGRGGLRGVFIGSVTQKVLNRSTVPVLVLH